MPLTQIFFVADHEVTDQCQRDFINKAIEVIILQKFLDSFNIYFHFLVNYQLSEYVKYYQKFSPLSVLTLPNHTGSDLSHERMILITNLQLSS